MGVPVNQSLLYKLCRATQDMSQWLSNGLFAPRCLVCDEPSSNGYDLCGACAATLPWIDAACSRCAQPLPGTESQPTPCGTCQQSRSPLQYTHATFIYADPVKTLLHRFKFHQDLAAGRLLAQLMTQPIPRLRRLSVEDQPLALLPVPLHISRLRQRGYDQALELTKALAHHLQLPVLHGLRRIRATQAQSQLTASARKRNVRNAFVARMATLPPHVALVDDVMTTGATLYAAAYALRRAGVQRIDAWVCAKVP